MKDMIIGLIQNTAILFAFAMLYENFWLKHEYTNNLKDKILTGVVLGVIGGVLMYTPWILVPGIVFDTRSIMLSVSGLFFGPVPTIIAMLMTGSLRMMIGGDGIWMGLGVILTSGAIGLIWRAYRPSWRQKNIYIELLSMGVIVHLVMLGCVMLLPSKEIIHTIKSIAIPLIVVYSPCTMLLGYLLLRQSVNFRNRSANEKLNESERRLGLILKSGNIASVILDPYGCVVFCNKYLLDLTGYAEKEVLNQYWFDLFLPLYLREDFKSIFNDSINGNLEGGQHENEIITRNGGKVFISWQFTNLLDEKNEVTGMACIGVNITDRINYVLTLDAKNKEIEIQNLEYQQINKEYHQLNEELNKTNLELIRAKEKAEKSDRLKSAFLANMSHEIRTPMNGILGFANLLKESELTGEMQKEYIGFIEKGGVRMINTINDLIEISKIESGQTELKLTECDLIDQINKIYSVFKPEAEEKGIQLIINNRLSSKHTNVLTDYEKINIIFNNLLRNAIKYCDKGTIEISMQLKELHGNENNTIPVSYNKTIYPQKVIQFLVRDSGVGIPHDKLEIIFNRFVQADLVDKKAYQGAGLGLSISKSYIEMLGGKIWVESVPGVGSAFYFTIPLRLPEYDQISFYS